MSQHGYTPPVLLEIELGRAAARGRTPAWVAALCLKLECGEIDPAGALAALDPSEAESVRRLALVCLREIRERMDLHSPR